MKAVAEGIETDTALVERTLDGDNRAFDLLVERHAGRLYRLARRLGLSPEDAADAVQETFLAAYRALPSFDFAYQFSTWVTRILLNRASNIRRALSRARRLFVSRESPIPEEHQCASTGGSPERLAEQRDLEGALRRALSKLPEAQRTVFILFELEGYKTREIAEILDIPEGTVTSRLHHARRLLRGELKQFLK